MFKKQAFTVRWGGRFKSKDKQFIAKVTAKREFSMLTQGKFDFWKGNIYLILQCYEVVEILLDLLES